MLRRMTDPTPETPGGGQPDEELPRWLRSRLPPRGLRGQSSAVVEVIVSQPARASYDTAQQVAVLAGVNVATVTRTAQRLGYDGWPQLQRELRARHLAHLSAPDVARAHAAADPPTTSPVQRDLESLSMTLRSRVMGQVSVVASAIASARRTLVIADGSYAALAMALAHNARLAGYDVEDVLDGGASVANRLATVAPGDVVLLVSFWRLYETAVVAASAAHQAGARVFLLTDAVSADLAGHVEEALVVPAEGAAFFPSMTSGLAVLQAVVTELADLDPARTHASVAAAEREWQRFALLHRRTGRS